MIEIDQDRLVLDCFNRLITNSVTSVYNANCNRIGKGQKSSLNLD
jgi:hypothetical protein